MTEIERRSEEARAHIRATIMNEFCDVMHKTGLPPMTVMRLAAQAIGSIYREVADVHTGPTACSCGWHPCNGSDMELLSAALKSACQRCGSDDLRQMRVIGNAQLSSIFQLSAGISRHIQVDYSSLLRPELSSYCHAIYIFEIGRQLIDKYLRH